MDILLRAAAFHVSLVVIPLDDFTGKPVTGNSVKIFIPGQKPPIVKADGYHVFVNLTDAKVVVHSESMLYHPRTEEVIFGKEETLIIRLRLSPNVCYPVPAGATCVKGTAVPGKRMVFRNIGGQGAYKLLDEYSHTNEDKDYISLYDQQGSNFAGRTLFIQSKDKKCQEYFTVVEMEGGGRCQLARPLKYDYKKAGTMVCPVYEVYADEKGDFFLLAASRSMEEEAWLWETEGGGGAKEIVLKPGQVNKIVWKEER